MAFKETIAVIKDSATGLREALLVILLLVLLVDPPRLARWLDHSNLDKVGIFGISFETKKAVAESRTQTLDVANKLQQLQTRATDAETRAKELQAALDKVVAAAPAGAVPASLAAAKEQVDRLASDAAQTVQLTQAAQQQTTQAIARQSATLVQVGGRVAADVGWAMAGRTDASGTAWIGRPNVTAASPSELSATAKFWTETNLRAVDGQGWYSDRPIIDVLRANEQVKVLDTARSPAKAGGSFLWLKVDRGN